MDNDTQKINLEDMFIDPDKYVVRNDLDQFDPSDYYSKNDILEKAIELYKGKIGADVGLELGASLFYLSSFCDYKPLEDINFKEEAEKFSDSVFAYYLELTFSTLKTIINMQSEEKQKKIQETYQKLIDKFGKITPSI